MEKYGKYGHNAKIWKNMENMDFKDHSRNPKTSQKHVFRTFHSHRNSGKKYGFPYKWEP